MLRQYLSVCLVSHLHNYANDRNRLPSFGCCFSGQNKIHINLSAPGIQCLIDALRSRTRSHTTPNLYQHNRIVRIIGGCELRPEWIRTENRLMPFFTVRLNLNNLSCVCFFVRSLARTLEADRHIYGHRFSDTFNSNSRIPVSSELWFVDARRA